MTSASEPQILDVNVACVRCGYNLRSLRRDGRCPECNAQIAVSLRYELLSMADPRWIGRMRFAAILTQIAFFLPAALLLGVGIFWVGWTSVLFFISGLVTRFGWMVLFAFVLLVLSSIWIMAERQPNARRTKGGEACRIMIRACVVIELCGTLLLCLVWARSYWDRGCTAILLTSTPLGAAAAIRSWAMAVHFRNLAAGLNDAMAARSTVQYALLFTLAWPPFAFPLWAENGTPNQYFSMFFIGLMLVVPFGLLVLGTPSNLAKRLSQASRAARSMIEAAGD